MENNKKINKNCHPKTCYSETLKVRSKCLVFLLFLILNHLSNLVTYNHALRYEWLHWDYFWDARHRPVYLFIYFFLGRGGFDLQTPLAGSQNYWNGSRSSGTQLARLFIVLFGFSQGGNYCACASVILTSTPTRTWQLMTAALQFAVFLRSPSL